MSMESLRKNEEPEESDEGEPRHRYEGYSHYKSVSKSVLRSVDHAVDSYAAISAAHASGANITAENAALARRDIQAAAMKLIPELRHQAGEIDEDGEPENKYQEILFRWQSGTDNAEDGYIQAIREVSFMDGLPGWVHQFVIDIRVAAWELGYTQAGRMEVEDDTSLSAIDEDVNAMFEGLNIHA